MSEQYTQVQKVNMLDVSAELLVTSRGQKLSQQPRVEFSNLGKDISTKQVTIYMKVVHSEGICLQDCMETSLFHQHQNIF